ncbi:HPr family phosphocarrier protein [Salipaludibacillus sp. CF4.18]|uniref:HPr family phosphocarrier protein n=1 Tax=Salipaludibacillus sp. CF4.18 TaxID=3373081 RepID=UPI003EE5EF88
MPKTITKQITINLSEEQTIVELSKSVQSLRSDIYLKKFLNGNMIEINLNSFLGLITLQLKNNERITVRAVGDDCEDALNRVVEFLT